MLSSDFALQIIANLIAGLIVVVVAYYVWNKEHAE